LESVAFDGVQPPPKARIKSTRPEHFPIELIRKIALVFCFYALFNPKSASHFSESALAGGALYALRIRPLLRGVKHAKHENLLGVERIDNDVVRSNDHFPRPWNSAGAK